MFPDKLDYPVAMMLALAAATVVAFVAIGRAVFGAQVFW